MLNDFRYTLRVLSNTPAFTISACLVMAVGIGVNVAVFSVADAALFRPLPYEEPQRLVHAYQMVTTVAGERVDTSVRPSGIPMLRQFTHIFERIESVRFGRRITLDTGIDQTMRIGGFSPGLPQLLGVLPQTGRSFAEEDAADPAVLVLSDAYWARAFGRAPAVIGRTLRFHGPELHGHRCDAREVSPFRRGHVRCVAPD